MMDINFKECLHCGGKGKWIVLTNCSNKGTYCSRCKAKIFSDANRQHKKKLLTWCPNCGAKMEEKNYDIYYGMSALRWKRKNKI